MERIYKVLRMVRDGEVLDVYGVLEPNEAVMENLKAEAEELGAELVGGFPEQPLGRQMVLLGGKG